MTYMCSVAGIFVQGHMLVMLNVCIPVLLVTLLIALSSHEDVYTDIAVSNVCMKKLVQWCIKGIWG